MEHRERRCRETSPDKAKVYAKPRVVKPKPTLRKVQVVYYLSRNGQLEHPHYMEVTHLTHQLLRLKDVMNRLTVLRGKGMHSLYSWSCKRSYKNGYVWYDLTENDFIYPSNGAEYVLKGTELIQGCTENLELLQISNTSQKMPDPNFYIKRKPLAPKRRSETKEVYNVNRHEDEDDVDNEEEEEEDEEKTSYTSSIIPQYSRCSRGVSTDETELQQQEKTHKNNPTTELTLENSSPPSTTSSTVSDKANESNNTSKRFEDGNPVAAVSSLSRNCVLLQLISCGGLAAFRGKAVPYVKQQQPTTTARKSGTSLHKWVLRKAAAKVEEEDEMIKCMSENPRFGNLQAEDKEYFSGSIIELMAEERVQVEPGLNRSSSCKEERSSKAGLGEVVEEPKREKAVMKGKCIPRKKSSSKQPKK